MLTEFLDHALLDVPLLVRDSRVDRRRIIIMTLLGLVSTLLLLFELVLFARVVVDWAGVLIAPSDRAAAPLAVFRTAGPASFP